MGIRLKIASFWIPEFLLKKDLGIVAKNTIEGLDNILKEYAPQKMEEILEQDGVLNGNIEERRSKMANAHNNRVKALIEALGYEEAIKNGRNAMFNVGLKLGQNARRRLGVGNSFHDLKSAAKIMYKILGIQFEIENKDGNMIMIVNRCALSKYYSPESCKVLSAADEGVVRGLNEKMSMKFKERITEGVSECRACINEVKT